jgi:multiple sugar transport system permease protein
MPEYKPFSIYDDDDKAKSERFSKRDLSPEEKIDMNLEIEDAPNEQDEKIRQELKKQLDLTPPAPVPSPAPPAEKSSDALEKTPFLHGMPSESVEERAKELIRQRQKSGKVRDRRKVASIFDKPIEQDKPIRAGRTGWHPLGYRMRAFWFLFPAVVFFALFYLYPMLRGFEMSLTHYSPLGQSQPAGWENYVRAFQDTLFAQTVLNAALFTLLSLILGFWPPILLAILLNEITRGKGFFKVLYLLPFVIPAIPAANLWKWIFDEGFGVLNSVLSLAGMAPVGWLTDANCALLSIVVMFVWKNTGWFMLIYYASLQNLSEELYESAELDGAGTLKKVLHVTLPHLVPVMWILSIIQVLMAFQIFTEVYVMTNGSPMHTTEVIATYIYKTAFGAMDLGYASAMAMLMFAALFIFTMIRFFQLKQASR